MNWREVVPPEGRFRISTPADFVKRVVEEPYGSESCFRASVPRLGFLVTYIDLPVSVLKADPNEVLNTELEERVKITKVDLLSKKSTRFADCPAVRFKLHDIKKGFYVEGILLLAGDRRYQLAVDYTSESSAKFCDQFFNSFQLVDEP